MLKDHLLRLLPSFVMVTAECMALIEIALGADYHSFVLAQEGDMYLL